MTDMKQKYIKPDLRKRENLKEITFECAEWQCSVVVPPAPGA